MRCAYPLPHSLFKLLHPHSSPSQPPVRRSPTPKQPSLSVLLKQQNNNSVTLYPTCRAIRSSLCFSSPGSPSAHSTTLLFFFSFFFYGISMHTEYRHPLIRHPLSSLSLFLLLDLTHNLPTSPYTQQLLYSRTFEQPRRHPLHAL